MDIPTDLIELFSEFAAVGVRYWLGRPPTRIDLLQSIPAVDFEDAWPRRLMIELGGVPVPVLGREDSIFHCNGA